MAAGTTPTSRLPVLLRRLPRGRTLEHGLWTTRHRGVVGLLWLHAAALPALAAAIGHDPVHAAGYAFLLAGLGLLATYLRPRRARAVSASFGLLTASAILVHVTGGLTESHFHFFVVISVVTLYEDWRTFLLAFGYVVFHHGLMGSLMPEAVFGHPEAMADPWRWAALHGAYVLAAGVANVIAWRANEVATEQRAGGERRRADAARRRLAAIVDATDDAVIGTTPDGVIVSWNGGAERLLGHPAATMIGRSIREIIPDDLWSHEQALMARIVRDGRLDHYDTRRTRSDGRPIDVSLTLSLVRDGTDEDLALVGIARDITERKRQERQRDLEAEHLQTLALQDHLTGLGNTRHFDESLEREIVRGTATGDEFSIVVLDVDGFKGVNDAEGHAAGDRLLRIVADVMRRAGESVGVPCRLGGDEFGLILAATGREGATLVGEGIRTGLHVERGDVDVSFGVAVWPGDGRRKDDLVAAADAAMYGAKARRWSLDRRRPTGGALRRDGVDGAIERLLGMARRHLGMDVALIGEFDGDDHVTRGLVGDGEAFGVGVGRRTPLEQTYCRRMVDGRLPRIVPRAGADPRVRDLPATTEAGIGSYIGVPLHLPGGDLYGVLCCLGKGAADDLDERDVKFLDMLAVIAADELERARIEEFGRRLRDQATGIDALLSALEARDSYTGRHSTTVVSLAERVARRLGLPEDGVTEARQTAMLHDVGKIGVPDGVLRKPGPLDEEEWALMRRHPAIGAQIVASVPSLVHLAPAVRAEHERFDGTGYPDGLAGEEIPLASRITFVCDAYDAMTSDRPYRAAMTDRDARRQLATGAGTQFDPLVVSALIAVLDDAAQRAGSGPALLDHAA